MTNSKRFRFPKTVVIGISIIYVIIIIATYSLYYKEGYIACAQRILLLQLFGLVFQGFLNYYNYRSNNKIIILATLFVSAMVLIGVLSGFFNFSVICGAYSI